MGERIDRKFHKPATVYNKCYSYVSRLGGSVWCCSDIQAQKSVLISTGQCEVLQCVDDSWHKLTLLYRLCSNH